MKKNNLFRLIVLLGLILSACAGAGGPAPLATQPPEASAQAPDGAPTETTQAPAETPATEPAATQEPAEGGTPAAVESAESMLADQLAVDLTAIRLVSFEAVEWRDSCLEVQIQDMMCSQAITPGYKVTLEANGGTYEFHTDESGGTVLLASAPEPNIEDTALVWQNTEGPCETAHIGSEAVAFGVCGGALMTGSFVFPERAAELAAFRAKYASFETETPAGKVTFTGQGTQTAAPAEQRMITEWAHLVFVEAAGGRPGPSYGLAFSWHREGGIAGFCDDLAVTMTGTVTAAPCQGGPATPLAPAGTGGVQLTAEQLEQLYGWLDSLKAFEIDQTDKASADAMTIRLVFSGQGEQEATEADRQAILDFAAQLYSEYSGSAAPTR